MAAALVANAADLVPSAGFVVHRAPNPRYRPIVPAPSMATGFAPAAADRAQVEIVHRAIAGVAATDWQVSAGEEHRARGTLDVSLAGRTRERRSRCTEVRVETRRDGIAFAAGDLVRFPMAAGPSLVRLRGVALERPLADGTLVHAFGGIAMPLPDHPLPPVAVAGWSLGTRARDEEGRATSANPRSRFGLALVGFGRAAPPRPGLGDPSDSTGGAGADARLQWTGGWLAGAATIALEGQFHTLESRGAPGLDQRLEWRVAGSGGVLVIQERRALGGLRALDRENLPRAAAREDRVNAQLLALSGRAELHAAAARTDGVAGEPGARTLEIGGSTGLGRGLWQTGVDFYASPDPRTDILQRRVAIGAGRVGAGGRSLLVRFEHQRGSEVPGTELAGDVSTPWGAGRVSLAPRARWSAGRWDFAEASTRAEWSPPAAPWQIIGSLTLGADRAGTGRAVREGTIGIRFSPRGRDRGSLELRSFERALEVASGYELHGRRGGTVARASARDSARVCVTVLRAGAADGVADVLVSLDGRELRYTNADGDAVFEGVAPGLHVVAVEERSLPAGLRVRGPARSFVTVERSRMPEPVVVEVARPERTVKF